MKRVVVGIDPSTKLLAAVITFNGRDPEVWVKHLPDSPIDVKADWAERHTRSLISGLVKPGCQVFVFIEEPVVGRGGAHATITNATVRGGILVGCRRASATEIHGVNNQRWKKTVCGNGGISKPQIKRFVAKTWPVVYEMTGGLQDLCDAACINAHGQQVLKMKDRIEKQREKDTI